MSLELVLQKLHDVDGVVGSFFTAQEGELLASCMPQLVDTSDLKRAGPRLLSVVECFREADLKNPQHYVLRFADHRIFLRVGKRGLLCVLSEANVNLPALRMASRLVCRKIDDASSVAPGRSLPPRSPERVSQPQHNIALFAPDEDTPLPASLPPATLLTPASPSLPTLSLSVAPPATPRPEPRRASGPPESRGVQRSEAPGSKTIVYRGRKYTV